MVDRIVTQKIKSEVLNYGMDLVGFAPVDRWETAPFLLSPQAILPESKTVVVVGIHITDTWTEMGGEPDPQSLGPGGWIDHNGFLDRVAYRIVRILNEYNYKAVGVTASNIWRYRKMEGVDSWFAPDLSHMHAATAAGLAEIGWSGLAITPEFGPRVRFISIVTDAELEPTPMYDGPALCDLCMDCVKACPSAAMRKDFDGKPHEITIGGKKFKYANKNIWRCAWAEHFMLDLDSKTLEKDHIDEKDINNELLNNGYRGHERGVCQKVCIPPHLRMDKGIVNSHGKHITSKMFTPRYPKEMVTYKKLRDEIISEAIKSGIDITAVALLNGESKVGDYVLKHAPGMNTVIGFAMRIPSEAKEIWKYSSTSTDGQDDVNSHLRGVSARINNKYTHEAYIYGLASKMEFTLIKLIQKIEEFGYHAAMYKGELPEKGINLKERVESNEYSQDPHGNKVTLAAFELAEMSGLGKIDDLFTTSEYGEDVIVGVIVTDVLLDEVKVGDNIMPARAIKKLEGVKLKTKLENMASENLVSLFGVAKAEIFDTIVEDLKDNIDESKLGDGVVDEDYKMHGKWISKTIKEDVRIRRPQDYVPGAKSVIVLSMNIPHEIVHNSGLERTKQIGTYAFYTYETTYELFFSSMEIAKYLNKMGYKTFVTSNMLGIGSLVDTPRQLLPDARCSSLEAVAAGLGEIGRNGSLLTKEFGAHQRQIVIITDAEMPSNDLYGSNKICTDCGNCETKCSTKAFEEKSFDIRVGNKVIKYPKIMRNRCDWAKRYSLNKDEGPEMIGNKTHVEITHDGEVTIDEIAIACGDKDEVMKKRTVILEPCLRWCTAGNTI